LRHQVNPKIFRDHVSASRYSQVMSMHQTDEAIMMAVRAGDLDQLAILYRRYRDPLYDFFSRLTGNRVVSEDLVQDVFVRILKYRSTYQETSRFITWMYQIGRNARADYLRRHNTGPIEQSPALQAAQEMTSPESQLEESEQKVMLQCALMRISESSRELLILARFQEMKYEDIADVYGISPAAVKMRVYRATRELREVYVSLRRSPSSCNAAKSRSILPIT
jgi:RNA polymerase sigma-70 factor (ECF subfamily)